MRAKRRAISVSFQCSASIVCAQNRRLPGVDSGPRPSTMVVGTFRFSIPSPQIEHSSWPQPRSTHAGAGQFLLAHIPRILLYPWSTQPGASDRSNVAVRSRRDHLALPDRPGIDRRINGVRSLSQSCRPKSGRKTNGKSARSPPHSGIPGSGRGAVLALALSRAPLLHLY